MSVQPLPSSPDALTRELHLTSSCCEAINSPRSLMVHLLASNKEYDQLSMLTIDPANYLDAGNFADDYLVSSLMRKSVNLPLGIDTAQAALDSFLESERRCNAMNMKFLAGDVKADWLPRFRQEIARILGPLFPDSNSGDIAPLDRIVNGCRNGPGATVGVNHLGAVPSEKFDLPVTVTRGLLPYLDSLVGPLWQDAIGHRLEVVKGSKFSSVPKTARTQRGIAIEPTANMWMQLGIGDYMARRLRLFGCDTRDQSWNQYLASVAGELELATIDLSQASDSICSGLVLDTFPLNWVHLLDLCRSPKMELPGKNWCILEKWSSMGNGYTFALECVIFLALVRVLVPPAELCLTAVYGDDLIVPQKYAHDLIQALALLGFSVNQRKSFVAGAFFESCGTDWFHGQNVRPFFLDGPSDSGIPYSLQMVNQLYRWALSRTNQCGLDSRFHSLHKYLVKQVPEQWRLPVPLEMGDSGITTPKRYARTSRAYRGPETFGWEGYVGRHVALSPVQRDRRSIGVLISQLATMDRLFAGSTWTGGISYVRGTRASSPWGLGEFRAMSTTPTSKGLETRRGMYGEPIVRPFTVPQWEDPLWI